MCVEEAVTDECCIEHIPVRMLRRLKLPVSHLHGPAHLTMHTNTAGQLIVCQ